MAEGFVQTNVNLTEEDTKLLEEMMVEDAYDNRSAFVRRLIRLEWQRRQQLAEAYKAPVSITYPSAD